MSAQIALVQFPGSNCDQDCIAAFDKVYGIKLNQTWHQQGSLPAKVDGIILPGGFSYGDYLRGGALASHAKIMEDVKRLAKKGVPILGICNGFQMLTESHILPGTLLQNQSGLFVCKKTTLKVVGGSAFSKTIGEGKLLSIPVAHGEGRFYADDNVLKELEDSGRIVLQYCDDKGAVLVESNPNGSVMNIAGICNKEGNVLGMMPHPERAVFSYDNLCNQSDGKVILDSFLSLIG